jgi:hypothetical protein
LPYHRITVSGAKGRRFKSCRARQEKPVNRALFAGQPTTGETGVNGKLTPGCYSGRYSPPCRWRSVSSAARRSRLSTSSSKSPLETRRARARRQRRSGGDLPGRCALGGFVRKPHHRPDRLLVDVGPAERTFPSSQIAISQTSRCTSKPGHRPITAATPSLLRFYQRRMAEPRAQRQRRIRARSAIRQVAGAATEKYGLEAHRPKRPAQLRSPREPLSRSTDRKPRPGQNPQKVNLHPPMSTTVQTPPEWRARERCSRSEQQSR